MLDPPSGAPPDRVAVVGAGLAGLRTIEQLRESGFTGSITLVGAEPHLPYDRPPLSKQVLTGAWDHTRVVLATSARLEDLAVDVRLGVPAAGLDEGAVHLADGTTVAADATVIATGAVARRLPAQPDGVLSLRTLDDAIRLRAALLGADSAVIVGAGFIGGEVASSALALGVPAAIVEAAPLPLGRVLGLAGGELARRLMTDAGVVLHLGRGVENLTCDAAGTVVTLAGGHTVRADVAVVGVGAAADTDWLAGSGLTISNGVACGPTGRALGRPGVWALGDVAAWDHPQHGRRRHEHWTSAGDQAGVVARDLLGMPVGTLALPYVWSDQFGVRIQVLGRPDDAEDVITLHGSGPVGGPVAATVLGYLAGDRLCAVAGFGAPRLVTRCRRLLVSGAGRGEILAAVAG